MEGIEIIVRGNTPLETLARIAAFGIHCLANEDVAAAANRIHAAETAKEAALAAEAPAPAPTPTPAPTDAGLVQTSLFSTPPTAPTAPIAPRVPTAPATVPTAPIAPMVPTAPAAVPTAPAVPVAPPVAPPAPPAVPVAPPTAPFYSLQDIMTAGSSHIAAHPEALAQLNALMAKYQVAAISELKPDQINAFAAEMRAIGVVFP